MTTVTCYCLEWHINRSGSARELVVEPLKKYADVNPWIIEVRKFWIFDFGTPVAVFLFAAYSAGKQIDALWP